PNDATASATVIGGNGGTGTDGGAGGAGVNETLDNAVTGITSTNLLLIQNVTAGSGGSSVGNGTPGSPGYSISTLDLDGSENPVTAGFINAQSHSNGGNGGNSQNANAANGGAATSTVDINNTVGMSVLANANDNAGTYGNGGNVINGTGNAGSGGDSTVNIGLTNSASQTLNGITAVGNSYAGNGGNAASSSLGSGGSGGSAVATGQVNESSAFNFSVPVSLTLAAVGGAGGQGSGQSRSGGIGGGAIIEPVNAFSNMNLTVGLTATGGNGGAGINSAGGEDGGFANISDVSATGSFVTLTATATGGSGGAGAGGSGGAGGDATSNSTTLSDNVNAIVTSVGGSGGNGSGSGFSGGNGGNANSSVAANVGDFNIPLIDSLAKATGGTGGQGNNGAASGSGGSATARANIDTPELSITISQTVNPSGISPGVAMVDASMQNINSYEIPVLSLKTANNLNLGAVTVSQNFMPMPVISAAQMDGITGPGSLTIGDGVTSTILLLQSNSGQSSESSLNILSGSTLDITNNSFIINYGSGPDPIATIAGYIESGYANGAWDGPGINSFTASSTPGSGIAYADGADNIVPGLSSGQIEIMYTLNGDANLDGVVSGDDFTTLVANLGKSVSGWDKGDFNYDGVVNGEDFTFIVSNLGKAANGADITIPATDLAAIDAFASANGLMADVPEPMSAGLLFAAGVGMLATRRRNNYISPGR
ncbi:MAG TPA: PEP-CTERM sorting domain-containing protein, partial [Tepidisphaeraceae bacterium]